MRIASFCLALACCLVATDAMAQYPWPVDPVDQSHEITGAFSEYRDTQPSPHFHNAIDIPKADGSPVYAVQSGRVTGVGSDWIRVDNFAYVHVVPTPALSVGDSAFVSETVVGTIMNGYGHVHLTDGQPGSERQPLRESGISPFEDPWAPSIENIRFYHQPTRQRLASTELTGDVEITFRVREPGGPPSAASSRLNNGAYIVGYKVLSRDRAEDVFVPENDGIRFQFDHKPSNTYVHNVFDRLQSSTSSHVYIVTNDVDNESAWDTRDLPEGDYTVLLFAEDTRGNRDEVFVDVSVSQRDILPPPDPTLLSVTRDGDEVVFQWTGGDADDLAGYRIYRGDASAGAFEPWPEGVAADPETRMARYPAPDAPSYFRLTAFDEQQPENESAHGDVYAFYTASSDVRTLIVDGFDRSGGSGSWQQNWHNFAAVHGEALAGLGVNVETAANEQVESGEISLSDYDAVFWLLGDESTVDETFSSMEQAYVRDYLDAGGKLFVSGSEIAWDLDNRGTSADQAFIHNYLKVAYAGDDAESYTVSGATGTMFDGAAFNYGTMPYSEDYPDYYDPVNGGEAVLIYGNGRTAGVAFEGAFVDGGPSGQVVIIGFPFETISGANTRAAVMERVLTYFFPEGVSADRDEILPGSPVLHAPYPNPSRGEVRLAFDLPAPSDVLLDVFDMLGRRVARILDEARPAGRHDVTWSPDHASGLYIIRMQAGEHSSTTRVTIAR